MPRLLLHPVLIPAVRRAINEAHNRPPPCAPPVHQVEQSPEARSRLQRSSSASASMDHLHRPVQQSPLVSTRAASLPLAVPLVFLLERKAPPGFSLSLRRVKYSIAASVYFTLSIGFSSPSSLVVAAVAFFFSFTPFSRSAQTLFDCSIKKKHIYFYANRTDSRNRAARVASAKRARRRGGVGDKNKCIDRRSSGQRFCGIQFHWYPANEIATGVIPFRGSLLGGTSWIVEVGVPPLRRWARALAKQNCRGSAKFDTINWK